MIGIDLFARNNDQIIGAIYQKNEWKNVQNIEMFGLRDEIKISVHTFP